jgi:DNA transformation protein
MHNIKMPRDNSFKDYIVEDVLGHIAGITSRAMFSGHGIYLDGIIVGLIIDGEFYLKTDKETMPKYKAEGEKVFEYERPDGKVVTMPYVCVSLETLEDREKIEERIYESFEISKKAKRLS